MCFIETMGKLRNIIATAAMPFAVAFLGGYTSPISDPTKLRAIESGARSLMIDHSASPANEWVNIPTRSWPPEIADLKPHAVVVRHWGVDIVVKPDLDGGYGYAVPKNKQDLPMPAKCYSELYQGVFWYGPC